MVTSRIIFLGCSPRQRPPFWKQGIRENPTNLKLVPRLLHHGVSAPTDVFLRPLSFRPGLLLGSISAALSSAVIVPPNLVPRAISAFKMALGARLCSSFGGGAWAHFPKQRLVVEPRLLRTLKERN